MSSKVTHVVEIRRNIDGVVRLHLENDEWLGPYIWEDGNYSCDCNRFLFFMRAADEDEGEWDDLRCGDGGYSVRITDSNGYVLYEDETW